MKKVLLLYAAPGSGHSLAAQAAADALENSRRQAPNDVEPVQDWVSRYFPRTGRLVVNLYKWLAAHHPGVWGHVHDNPFYAQVLKKPEQWLYRRDFFQIKKIITRHKPDAVLAAHAFPFRALALFKTHGELPVPLFGLVTDFRAHRYWGAPGADIYFVSTPDARQDLIRHGVPEQKIKLTGIPLRREFIKPPEKMEARAKLNLSAERPFIAVMGGGHGLLPDDFLPKLLESRLPDISDWIIVCGSNHGLKKRWDKILKGSLHSSVRLTGYTDRIPWILSAADILLSKAGGVTASEALACAAPMVLMRSETGQESQNADYLVRSQAAVKGGSSSRAVLSTARMLLENPRMMKTMTLACRRLARPKASQEIVNILQDTLNTIYV